MLELMISKPTNSALLQYESAERQALPSLSGFADLLKANLPDRMGKSPLSQFVDSGVENVPAAPVLLDSPDSEEVSLVRFMGPNGAGQQLVGNLNFETGTDLSIIDTVGLPEQILEDAAEITSLDSVNLSTASLLNASSTVEIVKELGKKHDVVLEDAEEPSKKIDVVLEDTEEPSYKVDVALEGAEEYSKKLSKDSVTEATEGFLESVFSPITSSQTPIKQAAINQVEKVVSELDDERVEEFSEDLSKDEVSITGVGFTSTEVKISSELKPLVESEESLDESVDDGESTILATGIIEPEKATDKVLVASAVMGGSEKLGDRISEIRQENRVLKQDSIAEPGSQSTANQKGTSSDDAGQQSRGQSTQQQFMAMAQSTSQNTQMTREQQVERQFNTVLNDRVASQTLSQVASEVAESAKLSSPAIASERRALLPIGLQSIGLPVSHQKWGQALGQRVVYMGNQQIQQAQITLNPEKLGPVQVRLQVDRDQSVSVVMTAQHGVTREAMEAALPRLREMLEQAGMNVSSVDVNDQKQFADSEKETSKNQHPSSKALAGSEESDESLEDGHSGVTAYSTDNIVDYYA